VGEIFGLTQAWVSGIIRNMDRNISNICKQFYEKKKSVEEICALTIWTQKKAGGLFGLMREDIGKIGKRLDSNIFTICQQFYEKKKSVGSKKFLAPLWCQRCNTPGVSKMEYLSMKNYSIGWKFFHNGSGKNKIIVDQPRD
jgi:hypothetical protein